MMVRPLHKALIEAEVLIAVGADVASLNFTDAECLRVKEAPVRPNSALSRSPGLSDSGEQCGGLGEDKGLSPVMDTRGGKHRWMRYSST